jgi:hypothetical protein
MRQAREQAKRLSWLTEAQAALGWGIILILVALLGTIYLSQASRIAAVGRRVQILQNDVETLKRNNTNLERQIAEAQSLARLREEAIRLGFVEAQPEDIEYIVIPGYPVMVGDPLATPTPVVIVEPPKTMSDALWWVAKASISDLIRGEASE